MALSEFPAWTRLSFGPSSRQEDYDIADRTPKTIKNIKRPAVVQPSDEPNINLKVDPLEYYKEEVFYPFVNTVIDQLSTRFDKRNLALAKISYLNPARIIMGAADGDVFKSTVRLYRNDLKNVNLKSLKIEYNWVCLWSKKNMKKDAVTPADVVSTLRIMIENKLDLKFPNTYRPLQIYAVVPVTSCTAERTFSALRQRKTTFEQE